MADLQIGDIVKIHDGSRALVYDPAYSKLEQDHVAYGHYVGLEWEVVHTKSTFPATEMFKGERRYNDTMLRMVSCPERTVFTCAAYCTLVNRPEPPKPPEVVVTAPSGVYVRVLAPDGVKVTRVFT